MKKNIIIKTIVITFTSVILILISVRFEIANTQPEKKYPNLPSITEISPFAPEGESPWIELYNPSTKPVDLSEFKIVINDEHKYSFPDGLEPFPPKKFLLILFDGGGESNHQTKSENGALVFHSRLNLDKIMKGNPGQVAIYRKIDGNPDKLIGFISWGTPGSKNSFTPERNRIWRSTWFVELAQGFGDYNPESIGKADYTIGLVPGGKMTNLSDWAIYPKSEASPGKRNVIPAPAYFTPPDGIKIDKTDVEIAWSNRYRYSKSYQFQISKGLNFDEIMEDKNLANPRYRPSIELPEGIYYYRVKTKSEHGHESAWSQTMSISIEYPQNNVKEKKILASLKHKYQRKDTMLLCTDGCQSHMDISADDRWDNDHDIAELWNDHGSQNCVRASISMMVSFYGKSLSQDRIAYYMNEERPSAGDNLPDGDLAHDEAMIFGSDGGEDTVALEWALGESDTFHTGKPCTTQIINWINQGRPIMTRKPVIFGSAHVLIIKGYKIYNNGKKKLIILNPFLLTQMEVDAESYVDFVEGYWVGPVNAPNCVEDEESIRKDSDNDGIMDFDEIKRFHTDLNEKDTDGDGVSDKDEIHSHIFNENNVYEKGNNDTDGDGVRKELDPDE